jgi:hypothetical protein
MGYFVKFECNKSIKNDILKKLNIQNFNKRKFKKQIINLSKDEIKHEFNDINEDSIINITIMSLMDDYILEMLVNIDDKQYSMCFIEL